MPYINVKAGTSISAVQEKSLKEALGKAITVIPGKSETYLMVNIEQNAHLYFGGENSEPNAMVEVEILGEATRQACDDLTEEICNILNANIGIKPNHTYVKFRFVDTWGFNGGLF